MFEWWVDPLPGRSLDSYIERYRRSDIHERDIDYARERLLYETGNTFLRTLAAAARALP